MAAATLLLSSTTAVAGGFTGSIDAGTTLLEQQGFDMGVRVGWTFEIGNSFLTPEIGERLLTTTAEPNLGTFAGLRLSHGHIISPGVYGMVTGWTYDGSSSFTGGATIDVRAIPTLVLGVHGGYSTHILGDFITAGAHAGFQM
jgi:hypothetical protein